MMKKIFIISVLSILTICLISNFAFATSVGNMVENTVSDGVTAVENGGEMVGNAMRSEGDMIENGIDNMENMVDNGLSNGIINSQSVDDIGNGAKNVTESITTGNIISGNSTSGYTVLGLSGTVWMWIIIIIIFIVVIALICKYMKDHNDDDNDDEE